MKRKRVDINIQKYTNMKEEEQIHEKRIIDLSLLILFLLPFAVSCGEDKSMQDTTSSVGETSAGTQTTDILSQLGYKDFNNATFLILDANDYPDMHINIATEINGSSINDAIYKRDAYVKSLYNVNIAYEQIKGVRTGITAFKNSYLASDYKYQMIISTCGGQGGTLSNLATESYLINLNSLPTIGLTQNWWSSLMYEQLNLGGKMYFTTGDIAASIYNASAAIYANLRLLADHMINDNLPDVVRDGKWTLEYMGNLVKNANKDINEDNVMHADGDFFAFITQGSDLAVNGLLIGMGYSPSYISTDGEIIGTGATDEFFSLVDTLKNILILPTFTEQNDVITKTFKTDRAFFLLHWVESSHAFLQDMENDFLILPMPKKDETQTEYRSMINPWANCYVGVPMNISFDIGNSEFAGFITEALACASYMYARPIVYEMVYMAQQLRNADSQEMLEIIYNTTYSDFMVIYNFGNGGNLIANHIYKGEPLSIFSGNTEFMNAEVRKARQAWLG